MKIGDNVLLHMNDGSYRKVVLVDIMMSKLMGYLAVVMSRERPRAGAVVGLECVVEEGSI